MGEKISKAALVNSFNKIKSHFLELEAKISQNMAKLDEIAQTLEKYKNQPQESPKIELKSPQEISSTGNEGVQSINQSLINQSINHIINQSNPHFLPNFNIETLFQTLTNKEFLIFLTIFQADRITYEQIAQKLSLTLSCVRGYVSELIRKKTPLIKIKLKNRKIILSIIPEFKTLTSEQKLINIYYKNIDPFQTTLM